MRLLTVKDFIIYNNPCFNCNHKIDFKFGFCNTDKEYYSAMMSPVVGSSAIDFNLKITYSTSLKLTIFHKTNKFETNDLAALTKYLKGHKLFLDSSCSNCHTRVESNFLDFDLRNGYILPTTIRIEILYIDTPCRQYFLQNNFDIGSCKSSICKKKDGLPILNSEEEIKFPLLPLHKFRNKEQLINKIKTYLLFS